MPQQAATKWQPKGGPNLRDMHTHVPTSSPPLIMSIPTSPIEVLGLHISCIPLLQTFFSFHFCSG